MHIDTLLSKSEAWLQYAIKLNLLGENKEDLTQLRTQALENERIKSLLKDVRGFHETLVSNHKNADLPIHKLLFLLDLGFDQSVLEIQEAVREIIGHQDINGVYQSSINVPKHFGGSGEDTFGWALCDAPLLLRALIMAGADYDRYVKNGVSYLAALEQDQGFPCAVSPELGKFRGPGRKDECCPYAVLIMLKLFSEIPDYKNSDLAEKNVQILMSLWENSLQKHPYMFYMGTDFRKLKAPALWYDIVSVADVLSRFDSAKKDSRFQEMISIIKSKQDEHGFFTPESVYQKFAGWDFGQKKAPSPYLTYLCLRIMQRVA